MGIVPADTVIGGSMAGLVGAHSPDLHTVTTLDGVYLLVAGASLALFGWQPDEVVGRLEEEFVHADDAPLVAAARTELVGQRLRRPVITVYRFRCGTSP